MPSPRPLRPAHKVPSKASHPGAGRKSRVRKSFFEFFLTNRAASKPRPIETRLFFHVPSTRHITPSSIPQLSLLTVITVHSTLEAEMKERSRGLREQKFVGTAQLAEEASKLLARLVPHQDRQSVSVVPDERTLRYYSA